MTLPKNPLSSDLVEPRISVAVLGCTGMVGQKLIARLIDHPWFAITALAASDQSVGHRYGERTQWKEAEDLPAEIATLPIRSCRDLFDARIVFSCLPAAVATETEAFYAEAGYLVVSNAKNNRRVPGVPLVIPEINADHLNLLEVQQRKLGKGHGGIVTNPNCSTSIMALPLYPIYRQFGLRRVIVTTMQSISGAGYPGVPSLDILGNVIPYIDGEEEKMEYEIRKLFGKVVGDQVEEADFTVSAMCNRVPVRYGHLMTISFETGSPATRAGILEALRGVDSLDLPSATPEVLHVFEDPSRPQPILDVDRGRGMTVSVGHLRPCPVLQWKLVAFGHNTVRGAAGGSILNAECLVKMWGRD